MTLRNRFTLVGIGLVIFVLVTPFMVLYALGYKYDFTTKQITKTGSLIVKSEPRRSNIYLNDTLQSRDTDATLRFLLPGDYVVKIEKENYQSWTKRLNIKTGLVTWANQDRDFITLFYNSPLLRAERDLSLAIPSVNNTDAVIVEDDKINLYNPNRGTSQEISGSVPIFTPATAVSEDNTLYNIMRYPTTKLFSAEQLNSISHLEANNDYAAALIVQDLYQAKNQEVLKFAENVSGFTLENEHVWYVEGNVIKHANWNLGLTEEVLTLPYIPAHSTIIRGGQYLFAILDGNLYMINERADEIYRGVNYAYWDENAEQLVFANNNEALVLNTNTLRSDLIIRSSTPIFQPIINKQTGYLFFINENKIKAIELDGRDHRNVYTIIDQPAESFLLSEDGVLLSAFTETQMSVFEIR